MKNTILSFFMLMCLSAFAQDHSQQKYYPSKDSLVVKKLNQWQDYKFGLLMHWGPYSQWGVVESWSICPEDEGWCERRGPYANNYFEYVKSYEGLQKTFNPTNFQPEKWASAAKNAGMKYMVFTTKHHDGFCMFDSKFTDYKITGKETPFHSNPRANVTKEIFNAFRKEGLWVGAYFSKPDWHNKDYWDPKFPPYDRNPNYDLNRYPEKWNAYKRFTQNQINELLSDYGKVDILWLDGGWVQPMTETSPRWGYKPVHQDINMDSIAMEGRKKQPGLIVVDRAVEGPNQNYLTPEQQIPEKPLPYPWETCMTMGNSWSYVKNDQYKTSKQIAKNLALIISRGGNYLLNIAPGPSGDWDSMAYARLAEFGEWMKINQEAVYNTHPISPYEFKTKAGLHFVMTENNKKEVYLFLLNPEFNKGEISLDAEELKGIVSAKNIQLLSKVKSIKNQFNKSINYTLNPNEIEVFKLTK
jgi:alpha-L-fucosidase